MDIDFAFIGWSTVGTSDKIWGYFYRPTSTPVGSWGDINYGRNVCIFWAGRGKAISLKAYTVDSSLHATMRSKLNKGYDSITVQRLKEIWPTFMQELEPKLMCDVLAGKVK